MSVLLRAKAKQALDEQEGNFRMQVYTSDEDDAGTTSQVYMKLYGEDGATDDIELGEPDSEFFETGTCSEFDMNVPDDIGKICKIRVWHDNSGDSADWLLDKIVFVGEEDEIEFACGQWLSLDKDDEQIIRELPAAHPGEDVPEVLTYNVSVKTSKKVGSGTNANVYITVFGERGDTGVRNLDDHNYLDKLRKFERSNTDHFDVKAVSMGDLTKVIIGHDGAGSGAGWHLDRVKITDPATEKVYYFHCKKWLDEGEDDGLIERELEVDDDGESGDDDE